MKITVLLKSVVGAKMPKDAAKTIKTYFSPLLGGY